MTVGARPRRRAAHSLRPWSLRRPDASPSSARSCAYSTRTRDGSDQPNHHCRKWSSTNGSVASTRTDRGTNTPAGNVARTVIGGDDRLRAARRAEHPDRPLDRIVDRLSRVLELPGQLLGRRGVGRLAPLTSRRRLARGHHTRRNQRRARSPHSRGGGEAGGALLAAPTVPAGIVVGGGTAPAGGPIEPGGSIIGAPPPVPIPAPVGPVAGGGATMPWLRRGRRYATARRRRHWRAQARPPTRPATDLPERAAVGVPTGFPRRSPLVVDIP